MKKSKKAVIMIFVVIWIFISVIVLLWILNVFNIVVKENNSFLEESDIFDYMEYNYNTFYRTLVSTNSDWDWYNANWWSDIDLNLDDDNFNSWDKWWEDDDLDAFSNIYWTLLPNQVKNILSIDKDYKIFSNLELSNSWSIEIDSANPSYLTIYVLDWLSFLDNNTTKLLLKKEYPISWKKEIKILDLNIKDSDILIFNLENLSDEENYYKISGKNEDWTIIKYFSPAKNKLLNVDYYSNYYFYKEWKFSRYSKEYIDILTNGKKPIWPTFLRKESVDLTPWLEKITLSWDINDFRNSSDEIYLYREKNDIIVCGENQYFKKLNLNDNILETDYIKGWYYYMLCQWRKYLNWGEEKILFSTNSNILYVD